MCWCRCKAATNREGRATVAASYDRTSQRFTNLRAARDASIRTRKSLSDQIKHSIAADCGEG